MHGKTTTKEWDYPAVNLGKTCKNGRIGCACTRYRIVRVTPTLPFDLDGSRRVAAGSHLFSPVTETTCKYLEAGRGVGARFGAGTLLGRLP